jgi:acyl-CoA hydrolase
MTKGEQEKTCLVDLVFPNQTNHLGTLFGGHALSMMDMAASIAAHRYCRHSVVTASIERTDFLVPVYEGELAEVTAWVAKTGRTSMVVEVELMAENMISGDRRLCTRGQFNMVALDEHGKPTPIQPLK